jgi:hypothetical protein
VAFAGVELLPRRFERTLGLVDALECDEGHHPRSEHCQILGVEIERPVDILQRFLVTHSGAQRFDAQLPRGEVLGLDLQHAVGRGDGVVRVAAQQQCPGQQQAGLDRVGGALGRPAQRPDRAGGLTDLKQGPPQQVVHFEPFGIFFEERLQRSHGVLESTFLVEPPDLGECVFGALRAAALDDAEGQDQQDRGHSAAAHAISQSLVPMLAFRRRGSQRPARSRGRLRRSARTQPVVPWARAHLPDAMTRHSEQRCGCAVMTRAHPRTWTSPRCWTLEICGGAVESRDPDPAADASAREEAHTA